MEDDKFEQPPMWVLICTYYNYILCSIFGFFRDKLRQYNIEKNCGSNELPKMMRFPVLYDSFSGFYTRNVYMRVRDSFERPINSVPGSTFNIMERESKNNNWTFSFTGAIKKVINLGSYNYLGFAENTGPCAQSAIETTHVQGCTTSSPRAEFGTSSIHKELEEKWSAYIGSEDSITFGMGFATNSMNIPALIGPGCLILSDELNHASLVLGCRLSGAKTMVYRHNDIKHLEDCLKRAIVHGQERTYRPYKKIMILVEGIYSMEGSIVNLKDIIALKKKYKAYLYVDEAHSIGALGATGRGVVEYSGCDVKDVDVLMGTFTKSFGAAGGYISGSKEVISYLRKHSHAHTYATSMAPGICQQIITATEQIQGAGIGRINQLAENSKYFRQRLKSMGFIVFGNDASPVVPMMVYLPSKMAAISRLLQEVGIAVVVVGFPATPIVSARVRFCLSASHTREQLTKVLDEVDKVGDILVLKHSRRPRQPKSIKGM